MTQALSNDQPSSLDEISAGEASPSSAAKALQQLYSDAPGTFAESAYQCLKGLTLTIISGRRHDQLGDWVNLISQTAALASHSGNEAIGERMTAISDLVADWRRHVLVHSDAVIMQRPHVINILNVIKGCGGKAQRALIREETEIGDANLSRILGALEANGLVSRTSGRERIVALTAEAEKRLEAVQSTTYHAPVARVASADIAVAKSKYGGVAIREGLFKKAVVARAKPLTVPAVSAEEPHKPTTKGDLMEHASPAALIGR